MPHLLSKRPSAALAACCASLCVFALPIAPAHAEGSQSSQSSNTSSGNANPLSVSTSGTDEQKNMSTADCSQQSTADSGEGFLQSTAIVFSVGLVVITIGGLSIGLTVTFASNNSQVVALEHYLQQNRLAVREGLTLGAGSAMQDLADAFDIPKRQRARFGLLMRERNAPLVAMLDQADVIGAAQARAFVSHTMRQLLSDPAIGPTIFARGVASWTLSLNLPDSYYDPQER